MDIKKQIKEGFVGLDERRGPRLKGIEKKKRKAKAEVMRKLKKDDAFLRAKERLMKTAKKMAKRIAKDNNIKPTLVDLDKITIREALED